MKRPITFAITATLAILGAQARQADTARIWDLQECMRYAIENSPRAVRQQLASANLKASYHEAILQHLPSLSGSVSVSTGFGRNVDPATNIYTTVNTLNNNYGLSAGITIFNGLQLVNNTRASKIAKLRGDEVQRQVEDNISIETLNAYFNYSYTLGTQTLAREQLEASRENLRQGRRMMALGLKGAADVAQLEATLAADEYNLTRVENNVKTMELKLKEVMNYPPEEPIAIDTAQRIAIPAPETAGVAGVVDAAMATLPDTRMSMMDVRLAKLNLSTAKARLFPILSASAGIGTNYYKNLRQEGTPFSKQFKNNLSKSVSASLSIPVFGGWSRQTNIVRMRNNLRSSEQVHIETLRKVAIEVEQAVLDLNGAYSERLLAEKQVHARLLAYRVAQRKYQEGLLSALDLQTTANQLLEARATLLRAELTWQVKRKLVDYYKGIPLLAE
ncbi:TolC family protein [uncultured Rikenella sp.]|uniref:TolC family protein n=1 Tax=uncultured Rikenella sp. TaxID=368003 RepID=UPI002619C305|nr:TolC family protein [uncultured Rikenella sp.]